MLNVWAAAQRCVRRRDNNKSGPECVWHFMDPRFLFFIPHSPPRVSSACRGLVAMPPDNERGVGILWNSERGCYIPGPSRQHIGPSHKEHSTTQTEKITYCTIPAALRLLPRRRASRLPGGEPASSPRWWFSFSTHGRALAAADQRACADLPVGV